MFSLLYLLNKKLLTMKISLIVLILCLCAQLGVAQTTASKADQKAVKQLVEDVFQALLSDFDSTRVDDLLTNDFLLLEHGEVWNTDTIRNYIRRALTSSDRSIRKNKFDFVKLEQYGDMMWVAYDNYATWTKDGQQVGSMHWLESVVAIKNDKNWQLKMMHSTRVSDE